MVAVDWASLMTRSRFNPNPDEIPTVEDRHEEYRRSFQKDYDRVTFSSAFRRLQGKTQVHPFPKYDYTRVRLTHSLEVASVARTLGRAAGHVIHRRDPEARRSGGAGGAFLGGEFEDHPLLFIEDVATLVATAALAHDIGNPPFGHAGEHAVRDWFARLFRVSDHGLSETERSDFVHYEGNALGFRTLTRLQAWRERGGLRITNAVLGASIKYPHTSDFVENPPSDGGAREFKKFNVFQADTASFSHVAEACGLRRIASNGPRSLAHARHPFAYLVEAADDICYLVTDIEDGGKAGILEKSEAIELLTLLRPDTGERKPETVGDKDDQISYLRAAAIGRLVDTVVAAFEERFDEIFGGRFNGDLLSVGELAGPVGVIREACESRLYRGRDKMIAESAGAAVIFRLLDCLVPAALEWVEAERTGAFPSPINSRRFGVIPTSFVKSARTPYDAALAATDYIGGMTDKYAFQLSKELGGIEFPPS